MKKILLIIVVAILGTGMSHAIEPKYKGYAEFYTGFAAPQQFADLGFMYGTSTTHGFKLLDELFVGLGAEVGVSYYNETFGRYKESDYSVLCAIFADGRYNFLCEEKFSPFVGYRMGVGYNGYDENVGLYLSPSAGCSFNLTEKFGFDASLGYRLYTGSHKNNDWFGNVSCFTVSVGIHF